MPTTYRTEKHENKSQADAEAIIRRARKDPNFEQANLFPEDDGEFTVIIIYRTKGVSCQN